MVNIAFGLLRDTMDEGIISDAIRGLVSLFDVIVYILIPIVYTIFIKITKITIISGEMIEEIYSRIQLILGVLMIFRLSISVIQYIIDPDMMSDKSKGMGNVIVKILVMLVLLTAIIPLHIPDSDAPEGTYNYYLKNDGLLFGSMYFFQSRVLETNVLAKLILPQSDQSIATSAATLDQAGNNLAIIMLKSIVIHKNEDECRKEDHIDPSTTQVAYDRYDSGNYTPYELIQDGYYMSCYPGAHAAERYAFAYFPIVGFLAGAFVLVALVSFCVDIAMRAIKMAILRLIAPIPILSYIDPKSSEKGMFSNWVKTLTKTYLDVFIRLAIIYFVIFVIRGIAVYGIAGLKFNDASDAFAIIFIIIGLFYFAKQAPQFIYDAIGIRYEKGAGVFSGLGKIIGIGAAIGGSIGTARTYANARKEEPEASPGAIRGSAAMGAASGLFSGLKAALNAEDHQGSAALAAQQKTASRRAAHSTFGGRLKDGMTQMIGGKTALEQDDAYIKANKDIAELYDRMAQQADANGINKVFGYSYENAAGQLIQVNRDNAKSVKELSEELERKKTSGASPEQLKEIQNQHKAAQEHLLTAVAQGNYSDIIGNVDRTSNSFIDEMIVAYDEAYTLSSEVDIDLSMGTGQVTGDSFKKQHFTALNNARRRERSNEYKAHKSASEYNKK